MPLPTILACVAQNANQALRSASNGLGGMFGLYGMRTVIADLYDPDCFTLLRNELATGNVLFAFGFAGIGATLQGAEGQNFWDSVKVPFLSLFYDHPAYILSNHRMQARYVYNCYHIRDFYDAQRDYIQSPQPLRLFPQAFPFNATARQKGWAERGERIVYLKTGENPVRLQEEWADKPATIRQFIRALIAEAQKRRDFYMTDFLAGLFAKAGLAVADYSKEFWYCIFHADRYIRAWRSNQMALALRAFPADIYGTGWDHIAQSPGKARFLPPLDSSLMQQLYAGSRVVVNTNPFFRHGIHERVPYGLVAGCVTLTDGNDLCNSLFMGLPHYHAFEWDGGIGGLQEQIAAALRRKHEPQEVIPPAEERLMEHCPGEKMLQAFIEVVQHARTAA